MGGFAHQFYTLSYRVQAALGIGFVAWMIALVPGAVAQDPTIGMPLSIAVIAGIVSLAMLWPYLTPSWIAEPHRLNQLLPLTLAHLGLPLLYAFVGINAMLTADIPVALANQLAMALLIFFVATSAAAIGLGMTMCFTTRQPEVEARDNVSVLVPLSEAKPVSQSDTTYPAQGASVSRAS